MKKYSKKILCTIMSLMMIFSVFAGLDITSSAADSVYERLTYTVSKNEVKIKKCDSSADGLIVIPDMIDNYPVTAIDNNAFLNCSKITGVSIGRYVKTISKNAFTNCSKLANFYIDAENEYFTCDINGVLFSQGRTKLIKFPEGNSAESYDIPSGVTTIDECAFEDCRKLRTVTIPEGVKTIGNRAFSECGKLEEITLPESLTSIGNGAFYFCNSLTAVVIPDGVTSIGASAFEECSKLATLTLSEKLTSIGNNAFQSCESLTSVIIPDSVTSLGTEAFRSCGKLADVAIGKNITTIGSNTFTDCDSLLYIEIPENVTKISANAFYRCDNLKRIMIPVNVTSIGKLAFGYLSETEKVQGVVIYGATDSQANIYAVENNITFVPAGSEADDVFKYLSYEINDGEVTITDCSDSAAENIIVPDTIDGYPVTAIGEKAFMGCKNIGNITLPESIKTIGELAFSNCKKLESVNIPDGVTSIGANAFEYCESLTEIIIPDGVTTLGDYAFAECVNIAKITVPDSVTSPGIGVFSNCSALESAVLPDGIASIPEKMFSGCEKLAEIKLPDTVTSIGNFAFAYCENLAEITLPEGVKTIGEGAFENCAQFDSITIPDSVTSIGAYAFGNCPKIKSVTIPATVTEIGKAAFGCSYDNYFRIPSIYEGFIIYGTPGTAAETFADKTYVTDSTVKITFISVLPEEPPVDNPPADSEDGKLEVKGEGSIVTDFENNVSYIGKGETVATLSEMIKNEKFAIIDKNGNTPDEKAFVGTGAKILILDDNSEIIGEYTIVVPTDIDGNGKTTAADARLALRASAKLGELEGVYGIAADVTNDGKITASDARKILRISAGLEA